MKGKRNGCGNHRRGCSYSHDCADSTCVLNSYFEKEELSPSRVTPMKRSRMNGAVRRPRIVGSTRRLGMSITVGTLRMMFKGLPDDMEIVVDGVGGQHSPRQCGLSRAVVSGPGVGSYVFDGEKEESVLGSYSDARFMLRLGTFQSTPCSCGAPTDYITLHQVSCSVAPAKQSSCASVMDDTTLLKYLLGHTMVTGSGDLDWVHPDTVDGLKDAGEDAEVVDALIKRRSEFYPSKE